LLPALLAMATHYHTRFKIQRLRAFLPDGQPSSLKPPRLSVAHRTMRPQILAKPSAPTAAFRARVMGFLIANGSQLRYNDGCG
jgi:hypothetical protein